VRRSGRLLVRASGTHSSLVRKVVQSAVASSPNLPTLRATSARQGKILFINAVNEVTRERAQSFLTDEHLQRVVRAYQDFKDEPGFTRAAPIEEIRAKDGYLSIPLYVGGETQA